MTTALRLHVEEEQKQSHGREPLVRLYRHAPKLDRICRKLGLRDLSEFHDYSATKEVPAGVSDTIKIMLKSKSWFPIEDGLATLVPLLQWLEQHPTRFGLLSNEYPEVVEELRLCVKDLEGRSVGSCRFNLGVVPEAH